MAIAHRQRRGDKGIHEPGIPAVSGFLPEKDTKALKPGLNAQQLSNQTPKGKAAHHQHGAIAFHLIPGDLQHSLQRTGNPQKQGADTAGFREGILYIFFQNPAKHCSQQPSGCDGSGVDQGTQSNHIYLSIPGKMPKAEVILLLFSAVVNHGRTVVFFYRRVKFFTSAFVPAKEFFTL